MEEAEEEWDAEVAAEWVVEAEAAAVADAIHESL